MKRAILIAAVAAGLAVEGWTAEMKIGTVNLAKCFEDYYKTKQADSTLKESGDAYVKERQALITDFQKLTEERNKLVDEMNKPELAAEKKAEKQKEAEAKLAELRKQNEQIQEFDRVRRAQLDDNRRRMQAGIVKEITEQINKIARAQNFTLIFDSSGVSMNTTPVLVFAEERLDITIEVIRELNKNQPAATPAPAPPASKPAEPAK